MSPPQEETGTYRHGDEVVSFFVRHDGQKWEATIEHTTKEIVGYRTKKLVATSTDRVYLMRWVEAKAFEWL